MTIFLTVLHVMACLFLIVVVLLQRGKGAEVGAVFGGGASSTVFGSRGAGNFLTKLTTGAAVIFMVTSLSLAYFAREDTEGTLFQEEAPAAQQEAPAPGESGASAEEGAAQGGAPPERGAGESGAPAANAGGEGAAAPEGGAAPGRPGLSAAPEEEPESGGGGSP